MITSAPNPVLDDPFLEYSIGGTHTSPAFGAPETPEGPLTPEERRKRDKEAELMVSELVKKLGSSTPAK